MGLIWTGCDPPNDEQMMGLTRAFVHDTPTLMITGEVDSLTLPRLIEALRITLAERPGETVILDLSGVSFIASTGLRMLVDMSDEGRQQGTSIRIVVGEARAVTRPLRLTGLDRYLQLFHSADDAAASPAKPRTPGED